MTTDSPPATAGVVVVTGVGRFFAARVAARLAADPGISRVVGLDAAEPAARPDGVEFVRAEPADTAGVLADTGAQAVVHLAMATSPDPSGGGRAAMKDQNVIGTMQVLAACQQAPGLRKLVLRSSTAAYGASFRDPAVFTEATQPREVPRGGFARDTLDVEGYVRGFRRRRPDVTATVLRLAPLIGAGVDTSLTRFLAQPLVPTVLGRDPRLQFVHVDDALEVVHRSVTEDHPGTFNVAGAGVLALSQAIRRAGRFALPVPEVGLSAVAALAGSRTAYGFDQLDLLVHGRVVDTTKLIKEYGYRPRTTAEAFDDFVAGHPAGPPLRQAQVAAAERALRDGVRRVRAAVRG